MVPTYQNFSRTYQKIFPRPTKNVIFLITFHKFLQFCLSNFSQKSPLCRCGSYTHGSQRLMVSTEIIKNWGGGQKIILGGHLPPPLPPPCRRHCKSVKKYEKSKNSFQPEKLLKTFLIVTKIIINMLCYTGKPTDLIESSTTVSIYLEKLR